MSKFCRDCGHQIADDAKVCPQCGSPVENVNVTNCPKPQESKLPKLLCAILMINSFVHILLSISVISIYGIHEVSSYIYVCSFIINLISLISATLCLKFSKAYIGLVISFAFSVIMCFISIFNLYSNYHEYRTDHEEAQDSEQYASVSNSSASTASASTQTDYSSSEADTPKTTYAYEFVVSGTTYRISFDKREKTAQLYVKGQYAPEGKTFYGSCEYDGLYRDGQIEVHEFIGADDFDINLKGEKLTWDAGGAWIDYKNNYIYITQDAAKAMNPDYRLPLTPVK